MSFFKKKNLSSPMCTFWVITDLWPSWHAYSWIWGFPLICAHPTSSNTHKENWLPFPSCYQLSTVHWLGVRLHIHFLSICWDLFRLSLHGAGALCLSNFCGFLCVSALLCLVTVMSGDTVSLYPFTTSSCYSHSMLFSNDPWALGGEGVISIFH